jgi:hypothetical protein
MFGVIHLDETAQLVVFDEAAADKTMLAIELIRDLRPPVTINQWQTRE